MASVRTVVNFEGGTVGSPVPEDNYWVPGYQPAAGYVYVYNGTFSSESPTGLSARLPEGRYAGDLWAEVGVGEAVGIGAHFKVAPGSGNADTALRENINWVDLWLNVGDTYLEIIPHQIPADYERGKNWAEWFGGPTSIVAFEYNDYPAPDGQWAYLGPTATWVDQWLDVRLMRNGEWSLRLAGGGTLVSGSILPGPDPMPDTEALGLGVTTLGDGPAWADDVYLLVPTATGEAGDLRRRRFF